MFRSTSRLRGSPFEVYRGALDPLRRRLTKNAMSSMSNMPTTHPTAMPTFPAVERPVELSDALLDEPPELVLELVIGLVLEMVLEVVLVILGSAVVLGPLTDEDDGVEVLDRVERLSMARTAPVIVCVLVITPLVAV